MITYGAIADRSHIRNMATVARYIGDNGDILIPIEDTADNTGKLLSTTFGIVYIPQLVAEVGVIEAGNPMGLLLALTYPDTP